ncbi:pilus assembly protein PilM [Candidatus Omnitrophota bacterium]
MDTHSILEKINTAKEKLAKFKFPKELKLSALKLNAFKFGAKKADALIIVDIGSSLRLVNVELNGEIKVTAAKTVKLPPDKKEESVLAALRSFIQENKIEHKNAILKPSLKSALIKRLTMHLVPREELLEAVKWQLKEEASFDLSHAVIDFAVIKKTTKEDGSKEQDVISVAALEEEVSRQVLLLKEAGLTCLSVNLLPFGYTNLMERYLTQQDKVAPVGILHMEGEICYFTIFKESNLQFYRELPVSVDKLRESLKGVLVSDKGRIELSPQEADEVLFNIGVPKEGVGYKDKLSSTQIISMLRPVLERLAVEIKRSFAYYDSQFSGGQVRKIIIGGLASMIPGLDGFLKQQLSLEFSNITLPDKIQLPAGTDAKSFSEYVSTLGLAIGYERGINLLPHEFRTEKFEQLEKVSLRWIAIIVSLLLVVSYLLAMGGIAAYQKRLDSTLFHLESLSNVREVKVKADGINSFIAQVRKKESPLGAMFKKLSNIAPAGLFIRGLLLDLGSRSGKIKGYTRSESQNSDAVLTGFIRMMERSSYFTDVNISSVERDGKETLDVVQFNITFKLP